MIFIVLSSLETVHDTVQYRYCTVQVLYNTGTVQYRYCTVQVLYCTGTVFCHRTIVSRGLG